MEKRNENTLLCLLVLLIILNIVSISLNVVLMIGGQNAMNFVQSFLKKNDLSNYKEYFEYSERWMRNNSLCL